MNFTVEPVKNILEMHHALSELTDPEAVHAELEILLNTCRNSDCQKFDDIAPVSYTHLTLPTIYSV